MSSERGTTEELPLRLLMSYSHPLPEDCKNTLRLLLPELARSPEQLSPIYGLDSQVGQPGRMTARLREGGVKELEAPWANTTVRDT